MTKNEHSEVDRYRATPSGAVELAAASLTSEAARVLRLARNGARRTQKEVADILGISEGRVSQVLSGDGNVTVAALAKYLRSFGYAVSLQVTPVDEGTAPIKPPVRRTRKNAPPRRDSQETLNAARIIVTGARKSSGGSQGILRVTSESRTPRPRIAAISAANNSTGANSSPKNSTVQLDAGAACR